MRDYFEIFGLIKKFDIDDELDAKYFNVYKKSQNPEINVAYACLKNKLKRAEILCEINGFYKIDKEIAVEMFKLKLQELDFVDMQKNAFENIVKFAKTGDWKQTWYWVQKYSYFKKFAE